MYVCVCLCVVVCIHFLNIHNIILVGDDNIMLLS